MELCRQLGVRVVHAELRRTWGAWLPQHQIIVLTSGLTPVQERCTLAHEVEHALAGHTHGCGIGPYAELPQTRAAFTGATLCQEVAADQSAARKLVPLLALFRARQRDDLTASALGVTERVLTTRLNDLKGELWLLGRSKIAG